MTLGAMCQKTKFKKTSSHSSKTKKSAHLSFQVWVELSFNETKQLFDNFDKTDLPEPRSTGTRSTGYEQN